MIFIVVLHILKSIMANNIIRKLTNDEINQICTLLSISNKLKKLFVTKLQDIEIYPQFIYGADGTLQSGKLYQSIEIKLDPHLFKHNSITEMTIGRQCTSSMLTSWHLTKNN